MDYYGRWRVQLFMFWVRFEWIIMADGMFNYSCFGWDLNGLLWPMACSIIHVLGAI
jgi:hypothetical protein